MTAAPSPTTLAQEIASIRPRRLVTLRYQVISADGDRVRIHVDGEPDATLERRSALIGGKVILEVARRPKFARRRRALEQGARALIAVAKSIPEDARV